MNAPSRSHMTVGAVVADTYRLETLIGRGGMGEVYAASHLRLPGKQVALKFLHPDVADPEILARFRREAEIASRLGHPNIVTVLDFNSLPDGTPYLVLEYLVGETLDDALGRGPFSVDRMLVIARQLGSALAAAHRAGIVHRDLKPQNIFLVPTEIEGRIGEIAKILDFGISKIRGSQTVKTQDSALLGTPQYMSPEQATGQHDAVDGRTDIFALGAILYEMLSGQAAFAGASIPEVVFKVVYEPAPPLAERAPGLPPGILAAIERAMAKKPEDRFATVGELVTALTGVGLVTLPPPRVGATGAVGAAGTGAGERPGSRKVSSDDALAKTMGSGDHAGALLATAYEKPPPAAPAATMPPPALPPPATAANRWKWLAIALAALIAGVVAFAVVRQRPGSPAQVASAPDARTDARTASPQTGGGGDGSSGSASGSAAGTPAGNPAGTPVDAGTPPPTAPPDAAPTAPTITDSGKPGNGSGSTRPPREQPPREQPPREQPPREQSDEGDLGAVAETVTRAWKEAERDPVTAKKLANSVLDNPDAPDKARSQAHQVIALIACRADDRETAVRSARAARFVRPKIVKVCAEHDIALPRRGGR